ncbi:ecto-ADP-ribosyltransferase 3 [Vombatus ursinus]|uniref:ecto-ADP-ribosyltransferase 3 n=1 Tax=Vombatus ursinus TaxID=29139 RepID=UPI000FFCEEF7|nr:ecto-ADP-ribosyltransferase 3 [Vombatus ursinus]XP_027710442.1 ecto-ADP-ribosyltransferase 3 [Vombatus ursinus]
MKTNYLEMVPVMLAAVILMETFQVKGHMLSMSTNTFDDQYLKCAERMETKFVPKLLIEEKNNHKLFHSVWTEATSQWDLKKAQLLLPPGFQDNHGIALTAYASQAQRQTPFYQEFSSAVERAGRSRDDYIYSFPFKALHFYLTRALQLLSRECSQSYRHPVYAKSLLTSSGPPGRDGIRFAHFTSFSVKPEPVSDSETLFTVYTCFGISTEIVSDSVNGGILIPLNEVFQLTQEGNRASLVLRSMNKTCSYFDCAYLGGLKTENCVDSTGQLKSRYTNFPGLKFKEKEDEITEMKNHKPHGPEEMEEEQEPVEDPGQRSLDYFDNPAPAPVPFPSHRPTAASAPTPFGGGPLPLLGGLFFCSVLSL